MTTNIDFAPDGKIMCLYTEEIPLQEIGRLEVRRASNVEFNGYTQRWEVWAVDRFGKERDTKPLFTDASRQRCLDWEKTNFDLLCPKKP